MSRRTRRKRNAAAAGPSIDKLEIKFVESCGISSLARIQAAIAISKIGYVLATSMSTLQRYEVNNLVEVASAETKFPFLVIAKYLVIKSLAKVLIFKTQENMATLIADCGDQNVDIDIEKQIDDANNRSIKFVIESCCSVLQQIEPGEFTDPYRMHPQIETAALDILMQGLPRFTNLITSLNRPSTNEKLLDFVQQPSIQVITVLSSLIAALKRSINRHLFDMYNEGLGEALVGLLSSSNGVIVSSYNDTCDYLVECKLYEADAAKDRDVACQIEQDYATQLKFALKESKKGQLILRQRYETAKTEHEEKANIMHDKTKEWKTCNALRLATEKTLQRLETSICRIMEAIGVFAFQVNAAKEQCLCGGQLDSLLPLIETVDNGRTGSKHGTTFVRMFAARALGRICNGYPKAQQHVDNGGGGQLLMNLFNYKPLASPMVLSPSSPPNAKDALGSSVAMLNEAQDTIVVEHQIKETAANAVVQCCGTLRSSTQELLEANAVQYFFQFVQHCLKNHAASPASAAAASAIASLTASKSGLDIIGGKKVLPILLAVMANGTDSSSHAARIIGNAFSGAPPSTFACLLEVGGLKNITAFIIFITEKTLNRVNTDQQLAILSEVLRAGEMTIAGMKSSQDEVIARGILDSLKLLAFWTLPVDTDANAHGRVVAAAVSCLFACVQDNKVGLQKLLQPEIVQVFLQAFTLSTFEPAQTNYCRLFAILAGCGTWSQNLMEQVGVFRNLCELVRNCADKSTPLRAAITWACREGFHDNPNLLNQARELKLFEGVLEVAWASMEVPEVTTEIALLLRSASRSAENRELIRQTGGVRFCCQILCCATSKSKNSGESKDGGESKESGESKNSGESKESAAYNKEQQQIHENIQQQQLKASSRALEAMCYCEERNIEAMAMDENAVEAIVSMLKVRGENLNALRLACTVTPMTFRRGKTHVDDFVHKMNGMHWLCLRLKQLIKVNFAANNQHTHILQKVLGCMGGACIRSESAQRAVRLCGGIDHCKTVLKALQQNGAVPRKDVLKWEALATATWDALGRICKNNLENQQYMLAIGGSSILFELIGDGDLRNPATRGSGRDCARGVATGWGDAEDAMNIVLL